MQRVDLSDRKLLEAFDQGPMDMTGERASKTYWNQETGEMKYQIGEGLSLIHILACTMCCMARCHREKTGGRRT